MNIKICLGFMIVTCCSYALEPGDDVQDLTAEMDRLSVDEGLVARAVAKSRGDRGKKMYKKQWTRYAKPDRGHVEDPEKPVRKRKGGSKTPVMHPMNFRFIIKNPVYPVVIDKATSSRTPKTSAKKNKPVLDEDHGVEKQKQEFAGFPTLGRRVIPPSYLINSDGWYDIGSGKYKGKKASDKRRHVFFENDRKKVASLEHASKQIAMLCNCAASGRWGAVKRLLEEEVARRFVLFQSEQGFSFAQNSKEEQMLFCKKFFDIVDDRETMMRVTQDRIILIVNALYESGAYPVKYQIKSTGIK